MKHYWIFGMALIASILLLAVPGLAQTDVANIAAASAQADDASLNITGKVKVIGYGKLYYTDLCIQDSSGSDGQSGLYIYYASRLLNISDGDTISGVQGIITTYNGMRELSMYSVTDYEPTKYTGGDALPDPAPLVLTGTEYTTNYANYEGELIQLAGTFDSPGGTFVGGGTGGNTAFTTNDATSLMVYTYANCDLVDDTIPSGTKTVIGLAGKYDPNFQIFPRFDTDLQVWTPPGPSTAVSGHWELYQ